MVNQQNPQLVVVLLTTNARFYWRSLGIFLSKNDLSRVLIFVFRLIKKIGEREKKIGVKRKREKKRLLGIFCLDIYVFRL